MIYDRRHKVTVTHSKTGVVASVRHERLTLARDYAVALVRSTVTGGVADGGGKVVRSYELGGPWITDCRTGKVYRGADVVEAVIDRGEIERVR